jgi:hypothetical protein
MPNIIICLLILLISASTLNSFALDINIQDKDYKQENYDNIDNVPPSNNAQMIIFFKKYPVISE